MESLKREWLHIHIIENELYVFTDNGHWKSSYDKECREQWNNAIVTTFDALDNECYIGSVDILDGLIVRIPLNPKVLYGKFGMPYVDLT